ncbi:competence/damage-inducible protein A [Streptococcus sp. zg-86]|uniref:Putative competence-damage inducible protein n=1 Tax=Streptococcus zhangguiae TaxID=2664091 RepID=A0A6I4R7P3_9STRE|nr:MULTISPECIES: competence/damage-inducible protein A [unclassified Streptococcus]MTB63473.1 competence/damage-inducible protein A [Streptococcus sp. zg-86]MTB89878.1 competence/damage-inducible protein A [Streptococcus sp. zg-36]MWV55549.1 competence/damage-inducible protein A [Streptococcus sp. zg-70]QTH47739.1 competence/damage-inducible protein A [Streptococcus sp. zg-86]
MKAELIAVGTEILTGQIVNTNAQFLSEKCAELGIDVFFHTAVGDNEKRLLSVLDVASRRSELVVLCGGLGPTEDDLTKQTLAKFLGRNLVSDKTALAKLDRFFASRKGRVRTANNERQAQLVEGSIALQNPAGLAVGGLIEQGGVTYAVLPGPPSELKAMFTESLQPLLMHSNEKLYSRVLRFFGIGESQLVTILEDLIASQSDPTLAPYAKTGEVTLRLSTKADNIILANEKLDQLEKEILARENLASCLYGYGDDNSLDRIVADELEKQQITFAIAENVTAGLLQSDLTIALQGRQLFKGGVVVSDSTCNGAKAEELAKSICKNSGAILGMALLGTINPESQIDNVLARFYIAICFDNRVIVSEVELGGYTEKHMRQIACLHALSAMRKILLKHKNLL